MILKKLLAVFVLLMSVFQTSCNGEPQSHAWRALSRMNAKDYFTEPVHVKLAEAVGRGKLDQIGELIKQGADVNAKGRDGMRPLFWAIGKKSLKGFEILLQNGANPNVTAERLIKGERPPSVMELASIAESSEYLRLALKHGGDANFLVGYGNRTIIYEAILNNRTDNVRILIEAGADLAHRDTAGTPPIMTAAGIKNFDMVYLFLEKGADPKIKDKWDRDLAEMMKTFRDRGIKPDSEQYQWYLKAVEEMKKRGLLE
jgi:ankyrin repeat protein